jgi:glycosyltransferase involved in cell wall biosynthesis
VVVGKEKLEDFAKRSFPSGLPPWMRLAPEVDDVSGYYAASDVFLSASRLEGFPYGLAEAIATGLPVVRSDIWGTAYAADLPATVTFRLEDPDDLAHAVQEVLNWSPQERATRARAAADIVRARFGVESWARSVVAWYERILAGSQVKGWPAAAH